jgi:hypothetical protein
MARITSFTVFVWSTLTIYVILASVFTAYAPSGAFEAGAYKLPANVQNVVNGADAGGKHYDYVQTSNISWLGSTVRFGAFSPPKRARWGSNDGSFTPADELHVDRLGSMLWAIATWYGQQTFYVNLTEVTNSGGNHYPENRTIIANADPSTGVSEFRLDPGSDWDSIVLFYPAIDSHGDYAYGYGGGNGTQAMVDSIKAGTITMTLCSNEYSTLTVFDVGIFVDAIVACLSGFATMGAPYTVSFVLGGIFDILLALGIAKLIIG